MGFYDKIIIFKLRLNLVYNYVLGILVWLLILLIIKKDLNAYKSMTD